MTILRPVDVGIKRLNEEQDSDQIIFFSSKKQPNNKFDKFKMQLVTKKYRGRYKVKTLNINAQDYGVPQSRPRSIVRMYKKGLVWNDPVRQKPIPLKDSIGHLPSLMPGEKSEIKWHFAKPLRPDLEKVLLNTPTGKSALKNKVHFPKNKKMFYGLYRGTRIKLFAGQS